MKKIAFAVHGGASMMTPFVRKNFKECEAGLAHAAQAGFQILKKGGSALNAVEAAVILLEDNPVFNAGRGSALNCKGEIEMDASIMNGKNLKAGAVSMVRRVKNPIVLARHIMNETRHVCLSGYGALELAETSGIKLELDNYFITPHQYEEFKKYNESPILKKLVRKKMHGTVGAVALDKRGNLAAGTSTGGTSNSLPGRIGDSCVIGAGCYANNNTCAISGTGEGEYLIRGVVAHTIAMMVENGMSLQEACDFVLNRKENYRGEIGVISVDNQGNIGISFNTAMMKRAWISSDCPLQVKILKK